ncbi:ribosomal protein S18-alanine N-acetyltransferase [Microbacterium sp. zg.B48]|uniref:ribosomal protein S18-alanine N-acetyltransferase n=1 Tax=Microbacterium sp. zg.B48 TaxID=2969408 RepID=UPI00214C10C9|nr:ribosomal protein S18-alanine N-acetyltransferase [Microbacterium sp. zg.B48]MCR2764178.1 ribosomal protein S18-alanine N-acetyltransferase [Microbacterium sp. zg.B48]
MTRRAATADDLGAIMALERASFPTDAWSEAMMREELASPHGWYVVVEEAGRIIGYGGLRAVRGGTDADIQTIALAEGFRGQGRGRALLTALLDEAVRRGVRDVFLEVRADNPVAQSLYASEGFAEVGRRPRYYQPDDVDAIVMRLDLRGWSARPTRSGAGAPDARRITPAKTSETDPTPPESRASAAGTAADVRSYAPGSPETDAGACT